MNDLEKVLAIADDVCWFDCSENDQDAVHAIKQLRDAVKELKAAISAGARFLPAGHVSLPQSRFEAEVMNLISERYLWPDGFKTGAGEASGVMGDRKPSADCSVGD